MTKQNLKQNQEHQEPAPSSVAQPRTLNLDAAGKFAQLRKKQDYRHHRLVKADVEMVLEQRYAALAGGGDFYAIHDAVGDSSVKVRQILSRARDAGELSEKDKRRILNAFKEIEQYVVDSYGLRWYRWYTFTMTALKSGVLAQAHNGLAWLIEAERRAGLAIISHTSNLQKLIDAVQVAYNDLDFDSELYAARDAITNAWRRAQQQATRDAGKFDEMFWASLNKTQAQMFVEHEAKRFAHEGES